MAVPLFSSLTIFKYYLRRISAVRFHSTTNNDVVEDSLNRDRFDRRYLNNVENYLDFCQGALCDRRFGMTVSKLSYLPTEAARLRQEEIFVAKFLLPWWTNMEPALYSVCASDLIKGTLYGLDQINLKTEGKMFQIINSTFVLKIIDSILCFLPEISEKNFAILLHSFLSFLPYVEEGFKTDVKTRLEVAFPLLISGNFQSFLKYETASFYLSRICYDLMVLNVDKPRKTSLTQLLTIFSKSLTKVSEFSTIFDYFKFVSEQDPKNPCRTLFDYLKHLQRIGIVFIYWNVNADDYDTSFWSTWFDQMSNCFALLHKKVGVFCKVFLLTALQVATDYKKEDVFYARFSHFYLDSLKFNRNYVTKEEATVLADRIQTSLKRDVNREQDFDAFFRELLILLHEIKAKESEV